MFHQFGCGICLFVCLFSTLIESHTSLGICPFQVLVIFFLYFLVFLCYLIPHLVQVTSTAPGGEVTAAPQNSPNYVIIGASAAGGVLMLVIIAVVIRKCLCKTRTSPAKQPRNTGNVNDCLEVDLELSDMPRVI